MQISQNTLLIKVTIGVNVLAPFFGIFLFIDEMSLTNWSNLRELHPIVLSELCSLQKIK